MASSLSTLKTESMSDIWRRCSGKECVWWSLKRGESLTTLPQPVALNRPFQWQWKRGEGRRALSCKKGGLKYTNRPHLLNLPYAQRGICCCPVLMKLALSGTENHDDPAHFSLPSKRAISPYDWGNGQAKAHRKLGEKEDIHERKFKQAGGDGTPTLRISASWFKLASCKQQDLEGGGGKGWIPGLKLASGQQTKEPQTL